MTTKTTRTLDLIRQVEAAAKPEPAGLSRALAEALQKNRELESKLAIATARPLAITTKAANKLTTAPAQEWQPKPKLAITKAGFDKLTPADKMDFIKQGGKISN